MKCDKAVKHALCVLVLALGVTSVFGETKTVATGETFVLPATGTFPNRDGDFIVAKGGSVLQVPAGGAFAIRAKIKLDGGAVTLAVPEGNGTLFVRGGLGALSGGSLEVTGAGSFVFGPSDMSASLHFPLLDAPVTFAAAGATGIVLTNKVTFARDPGAPVTVADGACVALAGDNPLGVSGALTLARWDAWVLTDTALPAGTTVNVDPGRRLTVKPCTVGADSQQWTGTNATINLDVALQGAGSRLVFSSMHTVTFSGAVTGTGDIETDANVQNGATVYMTSGRNTFTGGVWLTGNSAGFTFLQSTPGDAGNTVHVQTNARIGFKDVPSARVAKIVGLTPAGWTGGSGALYTRRRQTVEVGEVTGNLRVFGEDAKYAGDAVLRVVKIADGATVSVAPTVRLKPLAAGSDVTLRAVTESNLFRVVMDFSELTGAAPRVEAQGSAEVEILGAGDIPAVAATAGGRLLVGAERTTTAYVEPDSAADVDGTLRLNADAAGSDWQSKVAYWFDAAEASTLEPYYPASYPDGVTYTNGFPLIMAWHEKRNGRAGIYLFNGRSNQSKRGAQVTDEHREVYPYVVTNGLNGMPYIATGTFGHYVAGMYVNPRSTNTAREARRLEFWKDDNSASGGAPTPVTPAFAVIVYGSQTGGGAAVLGTSGGNLARRANITDSNPPTLNDPFAKDAREFHVDGQRVDPTVTKPDGGWQILSIDLAGASLNAIGWNNILNNASGPNYAELIFFATVPTTAERAACEAYLARKWGLEGKYAAPRVHLNGTGRVDVRGDAAVGGGFAGTIDVAAGSTLTLGRRAPAPGEEAVRAAGRLAWFDPDLEASLKLGTSTPARPLAVSYLTSRDAAGVQTAAGTFYLAGSYAAPSSGSPYGNDRRPWLNRTARGAGAARGWLDYKNIYANDANGNTLRTRQLPIAANKNEADTASVPVPGVKQVFMVVDSSDGGGSLLNAAVAYGGDPSARDDKGTNFLSAIWKPAVSNGKFATAFTNVTTYLDNRLTDGTKCGFNGRPEVVSFAFGGNGTYTPAFFGCYNAQESQNINNERFGEILLYSSVLTEAERKRTVAYLANKWFGRVLEGYNDVRRAKLTGAGTVAAPDAAALPGDLTGFTGAVRFFGDGYAFTIDRARNAKAAVDAVALPGAVTLPERAAVTVTLVAPARPGVYTLVSGASLAGAGQAALTVAGNTDNLPVKLVRTATALQLRVGAVGTVLVVR